MKKLGFSTLLVWVLSFVVVLMSACEDESEDPQPQPETTKLVLDFVHQLDGQPLKYDQLIYENEAGNPYLVNEIQYFISALTLFPHGQPPLLLNRWKSIHYIDTDLPDTQSWALFDPIPVGDYDSIGFTFGIAEAENLSYLFVNPPESNMFWPELLGGGYHYMKLNGKWRAPGSQQENPFDFHLGRGQIYENNSGLVGDIIGFVENTFQVVLPASDFVAIAQDPLRFGVVMNVEQWFVNPHIYDHNQWGGYVMQNQSAMQLIKENGSNVFSIERGTP